MPNKSSRVLPTPVGPERWVFIHPCALLYYILTENYLQKNIQRIMNAVETCGHLLKVGNRNDSYS